MLGAGKRREPIKCRELGAAYLAKPVQEHDLRSLIVHVLRPRAYQASADSLATHQFLYEARQSVDSFD
jgi:hypothetical protein